jgi:hypothetical protein
VVLESASESAADAVTERSAPVALADVYAPIEIALDLGAPGALHARIEAHAEAGECVLVDDVLLSRR